MKTEEKTHTKGPWKIEDSVTHANDTFRYSIHGANNRVIAWTLRHYDRDKNGHKTSEIDDANARLIAAAPDLLEALEDLLGAERSHETTPGGEIKTLLWISQSKLERISTMLAKAKGE